MVKSSARVLILVGLVLAVGGAFGSYRLGRRAGLRVAARAASPVPTPAPTNLRTGTVDDARARMRGYVGTPEEASDAAAALATQGGLVLPKQAFAQAGARVEWYLRAIVPVYDPEVFRYHLAGTCDFVTLERRRVVLNPPLEKRGTCVVELAVLSAADEPLTRAQVEVLIVPPNAGAKQRFQMLLVGDSLGHQSRFPNELALLFQAPGNPKIEFVGTHHPPGALVSHEQYGGWRFRYFTTLVDVDVKNYHTTRSPFVFKGASGTAQVDVARYLKESVGGARPRNVHIQLGINDAFALDPDDAGVEKALAEIIHQADTLIEAIHAALPAGVITVGSVIQANMSDRAFIESYHDYPKLHSEWRWRRVQMMLARRMVERFQGRQAEQILLVPTHMLVDPLDGYHAHMWTPEGVQDSLSNAVHPSHVGDRQLAAGIYAVIKAELAGLPGSH